ncbi:MAG TPA: hypothetical protein VHT96_00630 [Clostridia bacterium]|nr:hypothetical protein [Clostridia bacterium]
MIINLSKPLLTSFTMYAAPLSLISEKANAYNWIYNNFNLLCCFKNDYDKLGIFYSPLEIRRYCPYIIYQNMQKNLFKKNDREMIEFIQNCINNETALYLYVDHNYISNSYFYEIHDLFIYGIDNEREIINATDTCVMGKYSHIELSFTEFIKAFASPKASRFGRENTIELLSCDKNRPEIKFSKNQLIVQLTDWLNSTCSDPRNDIADDLIFGIKVYEKLIEYMQYITGNGIEIDIRPFYVIAEHKKFILNMLKHINLIGYSIDSQIMSSFREIYEISEIIRNIVLKLIIARDNLLFSDLIKRVETLRSHEYKALCDLLNNLIRF